MKNGRKHRRRGITKLPLLHKALALDVVSQCFLYTRALNFLYVFFLRVILPACQADIISPSSTWYSSNLGRTSSGWSWNTAHFLPSHYSSRMLFKHAVCQDAKLLHTHLFTVWWVIMMLFKYKGIFLNSVSIWKVDYFIELIGVKPFS